MRIEELERVRIYNERIARENAELVARVKAENARLEAMRIEREKKRKALIQ